MEQILQKIGLRKNWIYEVIVTSGDDENPNAAPMGIYTRDFQHIKLMVYKDSATCENILKTKEFGVNFVEDMELFFNSIFQKERIKYNKAQEIKSPLLLTDSWLELKVKETKELEDSFSFTGEVVYSHLDKVDIINRGKWLALECLVKSTKIPHLKESEREIAKRELRENYRVIKKVAPDSNYQKILEEILEKL